MKMVTSFQSPNFSTANIKVEFVVLHYTACDLNRTFEIFADAKRGVCAHFVIDRDGTCYDLGGIFPDRVLRGAHAGISQVTADGKTYQALNEISLGVEIVNLNGNVFAYTDMQYSALKELIGELQQRFPQLTSPDRIVGHEHIAGFRGKCDPEVKFDWQRLFRSLKMRPSEIHETHACAASDLAFIEEQIQSQIDKEQTFWSQLSASLEERIRERTIKIN